MGFYNTAFGYYLPHDQWQELVYLRNSGAITVDNSGTVTVAKETT